MEVISTDFDGLKVIKINSFPDARGFFAERYNRAEFERLGLPTSYAQDNFSRSLPGVVRGLHYQHTPPQAKIVSVTQGRIFDVAVDIRQSSRTFGKHFAQELSGDNGLMLYIPAGFAHGFAVLGDEPADVFYKVDQLFSPKSDGGIRWDDPQLAIPWPLKGKPILSDKDSKLQTFQDYLKKPLF